MHGITEPPPVLRYRGNEKSPRVQVSRGKKRERGIPRPTRFTKVALKWSKIDLFELCLDVDEANTLSFLNMCTFINKMCLV